MAFDSTIAEKIRKLLALSESPNENEAKAALGKAMELMERHNISMEAVENVDRKASEEWITEQHGDPYGRIVPPQVELIEFILSEFFFVRMFYRTGRRWDDVRLRYCSWNQRFIFGERKNVEVARYTFAYLFRVFGDLWAAYRRANGVGGLVAKRSYMEGLYYGFSRKLREERKAREAAAAGGTGFALAIQHASQVVNEKFQEAIPNRRKVSHRRSDVDVAALAQGRADGRGISLAPGVYGGRESVAVPGSKLLSVADGV